MHTFHMREQQNFKYKFSLTNFFENSTEFYPIYHKELNWQQFEINRSEFTVFIAIVGNVPLNLRLLLCYAIFYCLSEKSLRSYVTQFVIKCFGTEENYEYA